MPTPTASDRARIEAGGWTELASHWASHAPTEREVVGIHDPAEDLSQRFQRWGHQPTSDNLFGLAMFAAGLAVAEAEAWDDGTFDVATQAYEARRFLLGDRIIHWAVPWLLAADAGEDARFLLDLGDEMRVSPSLPGREGLQIAGEDSFGPIDETGGLMSGWVGLAEPPENLAEHWERLAADHPGSAQLWLDLAARSRRH